MIGLANKLEKVAWLGAGAAAGMVAASFIPGVSRIVTGYDLDFPLISITMATCVVILAVLSLAVGVVNRRVTVTARQFWQSQDFLAAVVNNTADGIIAIDQEGIVRMYNPAAERMFGYEQSEIIGCNVSILLPPEDRDKHDGYIRNTHLYKPKILGGQRTLSGRRKDGAAVPVEISVSFMQSQDGPIFIGVCHDISARLQAEEALRASEERLQDAIETIQEGFVMYDAEDRLMLCNTRYRQIYGLIADVLVPGLEFREQLRIGVERGQYPEAEGGDGEWIAERLRQHRALGGQIERKLPNGRWVKIEERRTASGNTVGIRTDITELKSRERQLRESEERYRHLVGLLPDGVLVQVDGKIAFANEAMAAILGISSCDDLVGLHENEFIPPEDRDTALQYLPEASGSKTTEVREVAYLRQDGSQIEVERARAVIAWEGKAAFLTLARDITERKRVEKEIISARYQAEKANKVKSAFLANMSHELRTPLNAIIGFSDIIAQEAFGPVGRDQYRDYAGHIYGAGQHLLELINDILDLSKVEAGSGELHEEQIDVPELVQSAVTLVEGRAEKGDVRLALDLSDGLPMLYADERKMKQILVNILSNGVKFTEPGGSVTIQVSRRPDGGHIFRITDTGLGMAPEDIPKALTPFGRVKNALGGTSEGTGLGLPLTKKLVELHGGIFDLQSTQGVGTTVTAEFPAERIVGAEKKVQDRPG